MYWPLPALVRCPYPPRLASGGYSLTPCVKIQPGKARSDKGPKVDQNEIDNTGKVFDSIRRQPADRKAAAVSFTFRGEEYHAKKEECISRGAHVRGAVCFSGSKHSVSRPLISGGTPAFCLMSLSYHLSISNKLTPTCCR